MIKKENSNQSRINLYDLFLISILLFPIMTAITDNGIINKLIFGILFGISLTIFLKKKNSKRTIIVICLLGLNFFITLLKTTFPLYNVNLLFYYPYFLLYTCFWLDKTHDFELTVYRRLDWILNTVRIWSIVVGISIFVPSCYYVKEAGARYFGSWTASIFRLGPSALIIETFVLILMVTKGKKYIIYMTIPMYCFFMGSSRTYLVIGASLVLIAWQWFCKSKKRFLLSIIPLSLAFCFIVLNSAMADKISYTLDETQYGDFWFRITSSRSVFWAKDLQAWGQLPLIQKIFGGGLEMTYHTAGLWAHNDFIELLCGFGLLGLVMYIVLMNLLIIRVCGDRQNKISMLLIYLCWLFNAFFNMHFTYFNCVLGVPFAMLATKMYNNRNEKRNCSL